MLLSFVRKKIYWAYHIAHMYSFICYNASFLNCKTVYTIFLMYSLYKFPYSNYLMYTFISTLHLSNLKSWVLIDQKFRFYFSCIFEDLCIFLKEIQWIFKIFCWIVNINDPDFFIVFLFIPAPKSIFFGWWFSIRL